MKILENQLGTLLETSTKYLVGIIASDNLTVIDLNESAY